MTRRAHRVAFLIGMSVAACGGRDAAPDAAAPDGHVSSAEDGGSPRGDAGESDSGALDASAHDAGAHDAGAHDAGACTPIAAMERRDVPYLVRGSPAADALTLLDIYPPAEPGCGRPIVLWVHGGAWTVGDKANQMVDKIPYVRGLGAILVSTNYRLTTVGSGVEHPDHVEDVAAAFAWVHEHARELGGDPTRIAVLGHSAGAHLVALMATNPRFLAAHALSPRDLACVGSYDTEYTVSEIVARDSAYTAVFGSDPAGWEDASPSSHTMDGGGLRLAQLACRGSGPRRAQCEAFADALRSAGVTTTTIDASSLSHEEVNDRIGAPGDTVMTPFVSELLRECWR